MSELTTLIACKNRDINIQYCLESIGSGSLIPTVTLVDFGSDKSLEYLAQKYSFVKVIRTVNNTKIFHKARALNIGLKQIKTKYTCITDADQIFSNNFFKTVLETSKATNKRFIMCKTYFLREIPKWLTTSNLSKKFNEILSLAKNSGIKFHGDGCCNGFETIWAKKVRGYDESYVGYGGEDSDFALRAQLSGMGVSWIHNKVNMVHLPHPKTGSYYKKEIFLKNKTRYKTKKKTKQIIANVGKSWGVL